MLERLKQALEQADAIVIGAGAGLSTSAGFTYSGERFERNFQDFAEKYGIRDMYSGGFYPFETLEEYWGWWSRHIMINRYEPIPKPVYDDLLTLVKDQDYFVLTTNVDHCFQKAGFDKKRLFYTQGDYGLFQCSEPCHQATYDNEKWIRRMVVEQRHRKIPTELIPRCPKCGRPMTVNLRCDNTFVQDDGWYAAQRRYQDFLRRHQKGNVVYLELGVGMNTPGIIKYPFWKMTGSNPESTYICLNVRDTEIPLEIRNRSICVCGDIGETLERIKLVIKFSEENGHMSTTP